MKYRPWEVTVLLGHNTKRGKKKAPDAVRVVFAENCIQAGDIARNVLSGIKEVISVRPAALNDILLRARERELVVRQGRRRGA